MFGYHDSNRCDYDIWAPKTTESYDSSADPNQFGYGVWEDTPYHTATENRAFSPYAKHTQELESIIRKIGEMGYVGTIICDDDMGPEDMRYIEREVYKRYGLSISIS